MTTSFKARCDLSVQCLPDSPYKEMLRQLHEEMLQYATAMPLTDDEIEKLRDKTFSVNNPYCPVDSKSMRKAVRAAESAHGIKPE